MIAGIPLKVGRTSKAGDTQKKGPPKQSPTRSPDPGQAGQGGGKKAGNKSWVTKVKLEEESRWKECFEIQGPEKRKMRDQKRRGEEK